LADPFLEEQQSSGGSFDPMSLLRAFWRRKLLFFVPTVLCLAMAAIAIKTMTPIYASWGQIQMKFEGLNSRLLEDPSRRYGNAQYIDAVAYHEMNMLFTSPGFVEKMVLELRLQDSLRELAGADGGPAITEDQAIRRARTRLSSIMRLKQDGDRLFRIEVRDPDPEQAFKLATFIVERFVDEYRASQIASSTSTREFLQNQLKIYQHDLAEAEAALTQYQSSLVSESLLDNSINALNLNQTQVNLEAARDRYNGTDAREMATLEQGMRALLGSVPAVASYIADDIVKSTVQEMETVWAELMLYPVGARESREWETRLGQLRVKLNNRVEEMVGLRYPALGFMERNQITQYIYFGLYRTGASRVIGRLDRNIRGFRNFTARRPGQSSRMAELQEAVITARGLVTSIETEITQQTMNLEASASEIGMQIRIRKAPQLEWDPVEPDKLRLTLLGSVLSLGIGLGLVILAIFLDRSFNSIEGIERTLGLTVIGTLPVIQDDFFERKRRFRLLRWATIILGILAVGAVGFLVIYPRLS
jgi:capsular polysaccharide biosynthesis protein